MRARKRVPQAKHAVDRFGVVGVATQIGRRPTSSMRPLDRLLARALRPGVEQVGLYAADHGFSEDVPTEAVERAVKVRPGYGGP